MKRLSARITGRVQMVMFRDFARRNAIRMGLVGWVKNHPDGSVDLVAEGDEEDLQEFLKKLKQGPMLSRVENIDANFSEAQNEFHKFEIRY